MAIKVIIKRHIKAGKTDDALSLLRKIRSKALKQAGYISGETWVNHYDSCIVAVLSTWQTIDDWIRWEESDERATSEAELENLLEEPADFEIYDLGGSSKP